MIDGPTGEVRTAQIFVATLGASSYTYAEATWTQALPDWIGSHSRAFAYFGGVPRQVVPDNLKSGVVKACLYDPEINRTYAGMAAHYDTAIVPDAAAQTTRQSESGSRRPGRRTLDPGPTASSIARAATWKTVSRTANSTCSPTA